MRSWVAAGVLAFGFAWSGTARAQLAGPAYNPDPTAPATPASEPPLPYPSRLALDVGLEVLSSHTAVLPAATGVGFKVEVGYHFDDVTSVGLHLALGRAAGSYEPEFQPYSTQIVPFEIGAYARATGLDRLWVQLFLGLHYDWQQANGTEIDPTSGFSAGVGISGGVDVVRIGGYRLGVYGTISGTVISDIGYASFGGGFSLRR
jgi:hypothetical protein